MVDGRLDEVLVVVVGAKECTRPLFLCFFVHGLLRPCDATSFMCAVTVSSSS